MAAKPSLRTELLFNLAFLAAAALLLGVVTVLLVSAVAPERAVLLILTIVAADLAIFIVFGRYVVTRTCCGRWRVSSPPRTPSPRGTSPPGHPRRKRATSRRSRSG